jgi:hypothetical protein
MCYKFGIKQLYYFQTFDGQGEINVDKLMKSNDPTVLPESSIDDAADCDSCTI